jgi:hypothetical protein
VPGGVVIRVIMALLAALTFGFLAGSWVFLRMAQKSAYVQLRGQLGAASGALGMLNKSWKTNPIVGFTKQQDMVHRVVGPPGVILVGEGDPGRLKTLLQQEHKRHERVLGVVPIHEVVCGDGEKQVPIEKLNRHLIKLGRKIQPSQMTDILNRMKALDAQRPPIPMPKGPISGMRGSMKQAQRGR